MILYEQPAFNPHIRSSASMRKSPKRHLCDTSLAVAVLGLNKESLLNDLKYTGFLFESLVTHELNVYAKANDALVYHYKDSYDLEVDAIVQKKHASSENGALTNMVDRSEITGDVILIADRGYESYNNMAYIQEKGWKYLVRIKDFHISLHQILLQ